MDAQVSSTRCQKCKTCFTKIPQTANRDACNGSQNVTGLHVSLPTLTSSQTDSALDPKKTTNKELADDALRASLRSQRVLARSVKTEKRRKFKYSLRSREFPDGLTTLLDLCRSSNTGLSRKYQSGASNCCCHDSSSRTKPCGSRPSWTDSSSPELYSTTSFGRLIELIASVSQFIPPCKKNENLSEPMTRGKHQARNTSESMCVPAMS